MTIQGLALQKQDGTLLLEGNGHIKVFQNHLQIAEYITKNERPARDEDGQEFTYEFARVLVPVNVTLTY